MTGQPLDFVFEELFRRCEGRLVSLASPEWNALRDKIRPLLRDADRLDYLDDVEIAQHVQLVAFDADFEFGYKVGDREFQTFRAAVDHAMDTT